MPPPPFAESPPVQKDDVLAGMTGRWADFYRQYGPLRRAGREYRGKCPLHGGERDSFALNPENGLWHCFSGCGDIGGDVFDFLSRKEGLDFSEALAVLARWGGTASQPTAAVPARHTRRIAQTYDYTDEAGRLLFQVVRYEPKGFAQRRPAEGGTWIYSLNGVRRVLYRLPEVLAAVQSGRPIYICEGEKDADALAALGLAATTAPMGAKKWAAGYTETLCGAGVVLLPDNDPDGAAHGHLVAQALHGRARRVRVVALPNLPDKGDVSDWLAAGGSASELAALVQNTPDWVPPPAPSATPETKPPEGPRPMRKPIAERIIDLADVQPPGELPLLFGPYLLQGMAHWLTGQTGLGKSTLLFNIATALAEGTPLWGIDCTQTRVLYADMESGDVGRAHKIERLYQGAARVRGRLFFLREPVKLPDEMDELLAFVQAQEIGLVVFDTARRCFSVRDENDNAEVYNRVIPTLDALKQIGVASLTLGHPSKNGNGSARGAGAQEDAGDVNLSLTLHRGEMDGPESVIALRVTKNRLLGLGVPPLLLKRIGGDQFERVEGGDLLTTEEPPNKRALCRAALTEYLESLPTRHAAFSDLMTAMKGQGYTEATARRAKDDMEKDGELLRAVGGGYTLPDPFA
jgi:hypothetical protein